MLKFFRKIRQTHLSENKFRKYLIYAIGEIVLVVIGILIALSINNWNEYRKERNAETGALQSLQTEFIENRENLQIYKVRHLSAVKRIDSLMLFTGQINKNHDYDQDWILRCLRSTLIYSTWNPQRGVLDGIVSSGRLSIIQNDRLHSLLSGWNSLTDNIQEQDALNYEFINDKAFSYISEVVPLYDVMLDPSDFDKKYFHLRTSKLKVTKEQVEALIDDLTFHNLLGKLRQNVLFMIDHLEDVQNHVTDIIELVDSDLRKRKK